MPETNLFAASVSATGVLPTPPYFVYCLRALKSRSAATPKVRLRALSEYGVALEEFEVAVTTSWNSLSVLLDSVAPSDTVALEVLQITDGYVYYHTGANYPSSSYPPPETYNVRSTMDTDTEAPLSTLLMAGDILGQASYIRPMNSVIGRPAIVGFPVGFALESNLAPGANVSFSESGSARLLIVPGKFNQLRYSFQYQNSSGSSVKVSIDFRVRRTASTSSPAIAVGGWTEWVRIGTFTVPTGTDFLGTYDYAAPNPGEYELEVRITNDSNTITIQDGDGVELKFYHEVWT